MHSILSMAWDAKSSQNDSPVTAWVKFRKKPGYISAMKDGWNNKIFAKIRLSFKEELFVGRLVDQNVRSYKLLDQFEMVTELDWEPMKLSNTSIMAVTILVRALEPVCGYKI